MVIQHALFFGKVSILGVGLIGASLALGLRKQGLAGRISGYGRTERNLRRALSTGIIDDYSLDCREAVRDADLVVLCTPVGTFRQLARDIAPSLGQGAIVTDVGSVKGPLVRDIESLVPEGRAYVGSHPITGSDRSGIDDARADLFGGALCIVTPTGRSSAGALRTVVSLWERLDGAVMMMDPERHDEIYAAVSHLPHVAAYALVNAVEKACPGCVPYAGKGFRDVTRIALSSAELWAEIALFNRDNIIRLSEHLRRHLEEVEGHLRTGDAAALRAFFDRARKARLTISPDRADSGRDRLSSEDVPDTTTADQGL